MFENIWHFQVISSQTPSRETETSSVLLQHNDIYVILEQNSSSEHNRKNSFIQDVAFRIEDLDLLVKNLLKAGSQLTHSPQTFKNSNGSVKIATAKLFGNVTHTFIERTGKTDCFFPGHENAQSKKKKNSLLQNIDHIAIALEKDNGEKWKNFYLVVLHCQLKNTLTVDTTHSGMKSIVIEKNDVKFVLLEPKSGKKKSQIQSFIENNGGPGIQHIAFNTSNICQSVKTFSSNGMDFLQAPKPYYDNLKEKNKTLPLNMKELETLNILVEMEGVHCLLQTFTKPLWGDNTFFFELIQRNGVDGFGENNVKSLFESIEKLELEEAI
ncbi:MAG: hypothetical protein HOL16_00985 [Alphaproteobacteria bacterium]|nr:hypothetical protein [Alphaproteobacteria bacterium]